MVMRKSTSKRLIKYAQNYFSFDGETYKQREDLLMCSLLGSVCANKVMAEFERLVVKIKLVKLSKMVQFLC